MQLSEFITRDTRICNGAPMFRNTRVPLCAILASLADGDDEQEILKDYPTLKREHLRAAIAFAAASAVDDMPYAKLSSS